MTGQQAPASRPRRRSTIVDVARRAQVSTAAVSKVLRDAYGVSPAMRERVQLAMAELDYRPLVGARAMRGATQTIGVSALDTRNPFFGLLADGIQHVMAEAHYGVLLTLEGRNECDQLQSAESVIDHRMDGLILMAPRMPQEDLEQLAAKIPTVVIGRHGHGDVYDSIASDDAAGARLVVDHLVGLGHREIAYCSQQVSTVAGLPEAFREAGYRAAMTDHDLEPDVIATEWTEQGGAASATALLDRPRPPTAVHAGADVAAFGFLGTLWDRHLTVGRDLSVAGCDDTPVASMTPIGLTSVNQAAQAIGRHAAQLLLDRIRSPKPGAHFLHQPSLVVRTSTGTPPTS